MSTRLASTESAGGVEAGSERHKVQKTQSDDVSQIHSGASGPNGIFRKIFIFFSSFRITHETHMLSTDEIHISTIKYDE